MHPTTIRAAAAVLAAVAARNAKAAELVAAVASGARSAPAGARARAFDRSRSVAERRAAYVEWQESTAGVRHVHPGHGWHSHRGGGVGHQHAAARVRCSEPNTCQTPGSKPQ